MLPDDLCSLIPHFEAMCLLDELVSWDDQSICCRALHPTNPDNPLRRSGRLAAVHLIEYAGQAAALHGGLLARRQGIALLPSVLVAVRDIELHTETVDEAFSPLTIDVHSVFATDASSIYTYRVKGGEQILSTGRLTVMPLAGRKP